MTEKEKMLNGNLYLSKDRGLTEDRQNAKELFFEYNSTGPKSLSKKQDILSRLLGSMGENPWIEAPFYCDYGYNIHVGDDFYANHDCIILDCAKVNIGNNVMLAPRVSIFTAGHPLEAQVRDAGLEYAYPVTIGNSVWIGGNAVILPGVTIGDHSVIGAGSVVTRDIPENVLAVGNPCRVIKKL